MQQGDLLARSLDQQGFKRDHGGRALGAWLVASFDHLGNAGGNARRQGLVEQAFLGVDHSGRLVHLAQPEELVLGWGGLRSGPGRADDGQCGQRQLGRFHGCVSVRLLFGAGFSPWARTVNGTVNVGQIEYGSQINIKKIWI
ncbi:MAG: hypothetical protein R3E56_08570 [Burkholderiaceae bacterium]